MYRRIILTYLYLESCIEPEVPDLVKKIRMKKAKALLKSSNMTVENIAMSVGYQNVEHFNRLFKKAYDMTPMQFRNQK